MGRVFAGSRVSGDILDLGLGIHCFSIPLVVRPLYVHGRCRQVGQRRSVLGQFNGAELSLPDSALAFTVGVLRLLFAALVQPAVRCRRVGYRADYSIFVFLPRRFRLVAAWSFIALQLSIILTGNYNFFNLLTILCACFYSMTPMLRAACRCGWLLQ